MVPRPAALPLGILMVGLGGMLLFVAFHNLPPEVTSFPALLGYLSGNIVAGAGLAGVQYVQGTIPGGTQ